MQSAARLAWSLSIYTSSLGGALLCSFSLGCSDASPTRPAAVIPVAGASSVSAPEMAPPTGGAAPLPNTPMVPQPEPVLPAPTVPADWWNAEFPQRCKVLLDNSNISEPLTTFPVLIKLPSPSLLPLEAGERGQGMRIVDLTTNQPLPYEVEAWHPAGESEIWVVLPSIAPAPAAAGFWIYYGNQLATGGARAENARAFAQPFSGVWHLGGDMKDASPNAYDGIRMVGGQWIPGAIGTGYEVSVSKQEHIVLKNDIDVVGNETAATLSAWIKPTTIQGKGVIVTFGKAQVTAHASYLDLNAEDGALVSHIDPMAEGGGYQTVGSPKNSVKAGIWSWAVVVVELTKKTATFYLDGQPLGPPITSAFNADRFSALPSNRSAIGTEEDEAFNHYDGAVDEIRIERTARSAAWIAAQYQAMTSPTFLSWQTAEALPH